MNALSPKAKIVIVGGGTAGWLTACILNRKVKDADILLIESQVVPTIGVGEATIPSLKKTLHDLDLAEDDFFRETDATYKHGVVFRGWLDGSDDDFFYHTFEQFAGENIKFTDVFEGGLALTGRTAPDLGESWLNSDLRSRFSSYAYHSGVQAALCDRNLGPKSASMKPYQGLVPYAYHLDAARLGEYLAKIAGSRGVRRQFADVVGWTLADNGNLASITLSDGAQVEGDMFVDCSGFRALLIGDATGTPFVPYSNYLLCDRAVVAQFTQEDFQPRPYTTASAVANGWIWEIDTFSRTGSGHVYSSAFADDDIAMQEFQSFHGNEQLEARVIRFQTGRRQVSWQGNVCAIGLASGFLEPLESTGIFLIERAAALLASCFAGRNDPTTVRLFNDKMSFLYEEIRDFLVLHYQLSQRQDSDFWREVRLPSRAPDEVCRRLRTWKSRPPLPMDTDNRWRCFDWGSYRAVLWGMGHVPETSNGSPGEGGDMLFMPWAADRISDQADSHKLNLESIRKRHSRVAPEESLIYLEGAAPDRVQLSSGTRSPTPDELQTLDLEYSARLPIDDWRTASERDIERLLGRKPTLPGLCVSLVRLPDDLAAGFARIGESIAGNDDQSGHVAAFNHKRAVLDYLASIVQLYGDANSVTRPLGVGCNPGGGLPVTTRGGSGKRIGLHVDSWTQGDLLKRSESENRICINIGREPRRLLFLPITITSASARLAGTHSVSISSLGPTDIARLYMRRYPDTPVLSLKVLPGEAYIAPTENMIHDGSTLGAQDVDLFVTYLGRFRARGQ